MTAVDTNLLIFAFHETAPENRRARSLLASVQRSPGGWGMAVTSVAEFWCVATRTPAGRAAMASDITQAEAFIRALLRSGGLVWETQARFAERLLDVALRGNVSGKRIYDLQIALAARDNGATEIWTYDRNFATVPGLKVVNPLARS